MSAQLAAILSVSLLFALWVVLILRATKGTFK